MGPITAVDLPGGDERKETLASHVYDRLRHDILSVAIPPGEKLNIRVLCERFEVGLSPVREALSRLSTEGLVAQSDRRGFAAAPVSEADLADLTRARCWVNEIAIRQSIRNGDSAWEEGVVLAFHRLTRTTRHTEGDPAERSRAWETVHRNFHASLIAGSGSHRLEQFCDQLFDGFARYRHVARQAGVTENRDGDHRALMEAALARDADAAARLITSHFEEIAALVRPALRSRGG
jgi:GntR family transcriptional regulator, carbon starvation induced regulator